MKLNLIAAIAETVMRVQHRLVFVGVETPALYFFCAEEFPERGELRSGPVRAFALDRFNQSGIGEIKIIVRKRRRLIQDFMPRRA